MTPEYSESTAAGIEYARRLVALGKAKMQIEERYAGLIRYEGRLGAPRSPTTPEERQKADAVFTAYYRREETYQQGLRELQEEFAGQVLSVYHSDGKC